MSKNKALNTNANIVSSSVGPGVPWRQLSFDSQELLSQFLAESVEANDCLVAGKPESIPANFHGKSATYLDLSLMSAVTDYCIDDQVICVEAGMSCNKLDQVLAANNQWWPACFSAGDKSIGAVLGSGDGGCFEYKFGGPRDLVLGMEVALSSGEVIRCGGKVVKNVTGYDLSKLFIGSHGWLGIITKANLRVFARFKKSQTRVLKSPNLALLIKLVKILQQSGLPFSCLELVDSLLVENIVPKGSEIFDFVSSAKDKEVGRNFLLCLRVDGLKDVVAEVLLETDKLIGASGVTALSVDEDEEYSLWSQLSLRSCLADRQLIEVCLCTSDMSVLFESCWTKMDCVLWQYRPGQGRLKLFVEDSKSKGVIIDMLRAFSVDSHTTFPITYGDDRFVYHYENLGVDDGNNLALKQSLKLLFDPKLVLNPLVSM